MTDNFSSFAPNGFLVISDTVAHVAINESTVPRGSTGWNAIQALGGAAAFTEVKGGSGVAGLAGKTLNDNGIIYGPFGSIQLSSGTVIAYWNTPMS